MPWGVASTGGPTEVSPNVGHGQFRRLFRKLEEPARGSTLSRPFRLPGRAAMDGALCLQLSGFSSDSSG